MAKKVDSNRTCGCWEWLGLIVVCLIVIAIFFPFHIQRTKPKYKEAETKQNLHKIQLAIERFAVDHEGVYPNYLIGGSPAQESGIPNTTAFTSDELLRKGYLTSYPKNPFSRNGESILKLQAEHPTSITGNDPLRPGDTEGDVLGYRFGNEGNLMGQVLCDPRFEKWSFTDSLTGETEQRDTWAIIEYPFWDMWEGNRPEPYLLGMFFYKGMGPTISAGNNEDSEMSEKQQGTYNEHRSLDGNLVGPFLIIPTEIDYYCMGAYGSIRTKGQDVLGDEPKVEGWHRLEWTRSAYSATNLGGSPFSYIVDNNQEGQAAYNGNPNGISDAIIIVLSSGSEFIGK